MCGFVSVCDLALQASGRGQTNGRELGLDDQQGGKFASYSREPLPLMSKWVKSDICVDLFSLPQQTSW